MVWAVSVIFIIKLLQPHHLQGMEGHAVEDARGDHDQVVAETGQLWLHLEGGRERMTHQTAI